MLPPPALLPPCALGAVLAERFRIRGSPRAEAAWAKSSRQRTSSLADASRLNASAWTWPATPTRRSDFVGKFISPGNYPPQRLSRVRVFRHQAGVRTHVPQYGAPRGHNARGASPHQRRLDLDEALAIRGPDCRRAPRYTRARRRPSRPQADQYHARRGRRGSVQHVERSLPTSASLGVWSQARHAVRLCSDCASSGRLPTWRLNRSRGNRLVPPRTSTRSGRSSMSSLQAGAVHGSNTGGGGHPTADRGTPQPTCACAFVPAVWERTILECLRRQPSERMPSARAAIEMLTPPQDRKSKGRVGRLVAAVALAIGIFGGVLT